MSEDAKIVVEVCPETGICSIVKGSGQKVDLMPDELAQLRAAGGAAQAKAVLAEIDPAFAGALDAGALGRIREQVK